MHVHYTALIRFCMHIVCQLIHMHCDAHPPYVEFYHLISINYVQLAS